MQGSRGIVGRTEREWEGRWKDRKRGLSRGKELMWGWKGNMRGKEREEKGRSRV
jgi:hypothetical protein